MKKKPKNWNKLTLNEQESYLVKEHQELTKELEIVFRQLSTVRGGMKVKVSEEIHIHETTLKQ